MFHYINHEDSDSDIILLLKYHFDQNIQDGGHRHLEKITF